jgi:omega-amidase
MAMTLMSSVTKVPVFKPFTLALIQLGHIGPDKSANLKHAHEMILKAAAPGKKNKPDLIVLPVRRCCDIISTV